MQVTGTSLSGFESLIHQEINAVDVFVNAVQHLLTQQDLTLHVAVNLCFRSFQLIMNRLQLLHQLIFHFQRLAFGLLN
eukprot:Skav223617  [mRNA]  locus=scaffold1949:35309:35698:+ [translate_table: standard]